jgi:hypothetical protein
MDLLSRHARPLRSNLSQNGTSPLHRVGMLDLLDQDTRPTFIIDTAPSSSPPKNGGSLLAYWNRAMASADPGGLLPLLSGNASVPSSKENGYAPFSEFRSWSLAEDTTTKTFLFHGFTWQKIVVASRWNVISGLCPVTSMNTETTALSRQSSKTKIPNYDWTDELPPLRPSPHSAWARTIDWSATSLGPMSSW